MEEQEKDADEADEETEVKDNNLISLCESSLSQPLEAVAQSSFALVRVRTVVLLAFHNGVLLHLPEGIQAMPPVTLSTALSGPLVKIR